jgi:hypothetical protein
MPPNPRGNAAKSIADASPGPWKSWRIRSRHGRAIRFIETYCKHAKGTGHGERLRLAPFQKEFLEEALADGVDSAILETPRGNGKSSGGGALPVTTWSSRSAAFGHSNGPVALRGALPGAPSRRCDRGRHRRTRKMRCRPCARPSSVVSARP